MNIGGSIKCIEFIIDFRKNLSKLVTLVSYMVFKYPLELENVFNGLMDDLREVGEFWLKNGVIWA